jgi:hypothetical protein
MAAAVAVVGPSQDQGVPLAMPALASPAIPVYPLVVRVGIQVCANAMAPRPEIDPRGLSTASCGYADPAADTLELPNKAARLA